MSSLHTYIPQDRLRALLRSETLSERTTGTALFADISGFTPLTEKLTNELGPRRGSEELTRQINAVYDALITEVEKYGGSVISFAGDAITCWFDQDTGQSAVAAALALQPIITAFPQEFSLKTAITSGAARRFVVGDSDIQLLDTLAGATVARLAVAEHLAARGETIVDAVTAQALDGNISINAWRVAEDGQQFAVVTGMLSAPAPMALTTPEAPDNATIRAWILPSVLEREQGGHGAFLTELRPAVALFLNFRGIDYDEDEQASEKLNAFISRVQKILAHYESALLQLIIGDKGSYLYAAFGAPVAHEDDARRAVRAALELKQLCRDVDCLQPIQIGISKGTLRTGAYGGLTRRTYGALGDEVTVAARLMQVAAPGEILLSGRVQWAVSSQFVFEPRPPLPLKGKAEQLPVFAVNGERQQRAIRLQEPSYSLPMVGRTAELQTIGEKLDLTLQGKSQVLGIVAEAGLGKSRLVAEAIRLAHRKGFAGFGGACQSDAVNTPYLAWKPIWSAFFGVDPEQPLKKQLRLLEGEIEDRAPNRAQALPLLGILLNLEIPDNNFTENLEPQYRQSALRALLEDCLRAAAQDKPILIVIEDLHWMDGLSHTLLEELARDLADSPICFLLAYRPPQIQRLQAPRLQALPNFTRIGLSELSQAEAEQAIRAKLAQLYPARSAAVPALLVEKLMARAQGNPFYLEELLNYLHDRGLDPRNPADLEKIELPESLHSLIISRLDRLSEREKTTLRVASVIGRLFRADWLTGYYPDLGDLAQVKADLEQLAKLDITLLETPAQSPQGEPELAYLFKHIITHEVTYENLPYALRVRLHGRLAAYLEKQIAAGVMKESSLLETLVYHYTRSENRAKQREFLKKAGQAAMQVSAFITAVEYLTCLLDLTPASDPARCGLALKLVDAHRSLGNFPAMRAAIAQAQAATASDADRAEALAVLGELTSLLGNYAEAQKLLIEAMPLARTSGDGPTLCRVLYVLGDLNRRLGKLDEAKAAQDESLTLARASGDVVRELFALHGLGHVVRQQNNLAEAERLYAEVYTRAVAAGNRYMAMYALNSLGLVADACKEYAAARDYLQQALVFAREIGAQLATALFFLNLADMDIKLDDFSSAREKLREGLALALRLGAPVRVLQAVHYFGYLAHAEGQTERALALLGLARQHPAWYSADQYELDVWLAGRALDPAVVEAGLAQGAALDWDATIQELLKE